MARAPQAQVDLTAVLQVVTKLDGTLPMRSAFIETLIDARYKNRILDVLKEEYPSLKDVSVTRDEDGLKMMLIFPG